MNISIIQPKFHDNYDLGYIGFQYRSDLLLSAGIAYFTRFSRLSDIRVSHCFIVTGEHQCTEALASRGVCTSSLEERFADKHTMVFFRKPTAWTPTLGAAIAATANAQIGKPYDFRALAANAMVNLWIMQRLLNKVHRSTLQARLLPPSYAMAAFICSELCAFALDEQPALCDLGCLSDPISFITPQALFEDGILFKPWKTAPASEAKQAPTDPAPASEAKPA